MTRESRALCPSVRRYYHQPDPAALADTETLEDAPISLSEGELHCMLPHRHITPHAAPNPDDPQSLTTWPLTQEDLVALGRHVPPMWQLSARDQGGRMWMTFYEGGVRDGVLDAFTRHLPAGFDPATVTIAEVRGE